MKDYEEDVIVFVAKGAEKLLLQVSREIKFMPQLGNDTNFFTIFFLSKNFLPKLMNTCPQRQRTNCQKSVLFRK